MGQLGRRPDTLERRYRVSSGDPCPEHLPTMAPASVDWQAGYAAMLRDFSPDPADRAAYRAERKRYHDEHGSWPPRSYFAVCPVDGCGGELGWCAWQCANTYRLAEARRRRYERDPGWAERFGLAAGVA